MSVQTDINARTARLTTILEGANAALESKGGQEVETLAELPDAIQALPDKTPDLEKITVTPTGEEFTEYPDGDGFSSVTVEGDENLVPENIMKDVTIYGVTGTAEGGAGADTEVIPAGYASCVETAKTLYTGPYSGLMVMDDGVNFIGIVFLMDDFAVVDYNNGTAWFSMKGAVYCKYTKSADTWDVLDYRAVASTGEHYTKHIRYSTRVLYYGGRQIWPMGVDGGVVVNGLTAILPQPPETIYEDGAVTVKGSTAILPEPSEIIFEKYTEE